MRQNPLNGFFLCMNVDPGFCAEASDRFDFDDRESVVAVPL
jgi:hypothetical protein